MVEKSPYNHPAKFCNKSSCKAIKVVNAEIILPKIIPTSGTNTVSRCFKVARMLINVIAPISVTMMANPVLAKMDALGSKIIEIKTPSRAQSYKPAVVGETKRFRLNDCIIKPQTLNPAPATTIAIRRGNRLVQKSCQSCGLPAINPARLISPTPTNKEINAKGMSKTSK